MKKSYNELMSSSNPVDPDAMYRAAKEEYGLEEGSVNVSYIVELCVAIFAVLLLLALLSQ